jgi:hypothetical protein
VGFRREFKWIASKSSRLLHASEGPQTRKINSIIEIYSNFDSYSCEPQLEGYPALASRRVLSGVPPVHVFITTSPTMFSGDIGAGTFHGKRGQRQSHA